MLMMDMLEAPKVTDYRQPATDFLPDVQLPCLGIARHPFTHILYLRHAKEAASLSVTYCTLKDLELLPQYNQSAVQGTPQSCRSGVQELWPQT